MEKPNPVITKQKNLIVFGAAKQVFFQFCKQHLSIDGVGATPRILLKTLMCPLLQKKMVNPEAPINIFSNLYIHLAIPNKHGVGKTYCLLGF